MDIDDLLNFINEDDKKKKKTKNNEGNKVEPDEKQNDNSNNTGSKKKRKKKKSNAMIENQDQSQQQQEQKQIEGENIIHSNVQINENKYRSLLNYEEIEITNSRKQDNSHLRLIGNWKEKEPEQKWNQTNVPTKSILEQYPLDKEYPVGTIIDYGPQGIWRSTKKEKIEKENQESIKEKIHYMRKSAECHKQVRKYAQTILKPGIKMIDLCKKLETVLRFITNAEGSECGQAFPTGCSLNQVAAHYTPNSGDETVLNYDDVCKIDFGTHFNGYLIDCAFTVAFNPMYDNLLLASKEATMQGIKVAGIDARLGEIGASIQEVIESYEVEINGKTHKIKPVRNLMGHTLGQYKIHEGKCVPLIKSDDDTKMEEGELYAIETFASTGKGYVRNMKTCSHYMKDPLAFDNVKIKQEGPRSLFKYINKSFATLAFCPRWLEEGGFNNHSQALKTLCDMELVVPYPPLTDIEGSYVSQFEHSFMLRPTCKEVFSISDDY